MASCWQQRVAEAMERDHQFQRRMAAECAANNGYTWSDGSMETVQCGKCRKVIPGWPEMVGHWTKGGRALCSDCKPGVREEVQHEAPPSATCSR
jgi:hypothetical protein